MKQPVHSIKVVEGYVLVMRLKEPRFFAIYDPEKKELTNVQFENRKDYPPNSESLFQKAKVAVKNTLATHSL